jgi:hypothetical protein
MSIHNNLNKRILNAEVAFLGHSSKMNSITHSYNNKLLVCSLTNLYRFIPLLPALLFGPGVTLAYLFSLEKDINALPLYFKIMLVFLVVGCWVLLFRTIHYRRSVKFNFSTNKVIFSSKDFRSFEHTMNIGEISSILIGEIKRQRFEGSTVGSSANIISSYYISLILKNKDIVRVCETTKMEEIEELVLILTEHLRKRIEIKKIAPIKAGIFRKLNGW